MGCISFILHVKKQELGEKKGIIMIHPLAVKNWKDNKANGVKYQEAFMIIMSNNKQEELTGKRKIKCAITSFFLELKEVQGASVFGCQLNKS